MSITMTLGGHSLPLPDDVGGAPYAVETVLIAPSDRMADGSLVVDLIADKHTITVNWRGLSKTERDNLRNIYDAHRLESPVLVLPNGASYTVAVANAPWQEAPPFNELNLSDPYNPTPWYDVTITFQEV